MFRACCHLFGEQFADDEAKRCAAVAENDVVAGNRLEVTITGSPSRGIGLPQGRWRRSCRRGPRTLQEGGQ